MNFLAHLYLSGKNDEVALGNFIADAVKGKAILNYGENIKKGILLHREIDSFTDKHEVFKKSKTHLHNKYGRYSGVIVDIFYDHFLATNWENYSKTKLKYFTSNAYKFALKRFNILPKKTKRILPFMIAQNWLAGYANLKDLKRVFYGMDRRTDFKSGMKDAVEDLLINYPDFDKEFKTFFPDVIYFVEENNGIRVL
jgi:acyl carrier protein phosphodiesterase